MTAGSEAVTSAVGPSGAMAPADLARYAAADAAVANPELCFGPATAAFCDVRPLLLAGDRHAADGAGRITQDLCLQLCVSMAGSARASDNKCRFLAIMVGWAWPRAPAVGAVLNASRAHEQARWGTSTHGSG